MKGRESEIRETIEYWPLKAAEMSFSPDMTTDNSQ
jgi:hypothetical protein